jgi:hypothetical protein
MASSPDLTAHDKCYNVTQVSQLLNISADRVRREFRDYPGVLSLSTPRLGKRPYVTLLIPESVLRRWIREHTAPDRDEETPFQDNQLLTYLSPVY